MLQKKMKSNELKEKNCGKMPRQKYEKKKLQMGSSGLAAKDSGSCMTRFSRTVRDLINTAPQRVLMR